MPSQRASRGIINPLTNAEVCHVKEAQHFFQAADIYYRGLKQSEYDSVAKVCMDAFQALQTVRNNGPDALKETMTEWLERLDVEREKAEDSKRKGVKEEEKVGEKVGEKVEEGREKAQGTE